MRAKIALLVVLASFLALSRPWRRHGRRRPGWPKARRPNLRRDDHDRGPSLQAPACANGLDDDGDGLVDLADPDCTSPDRHQRGDRPRRATPPRHPGARPRSAAPARPAPHSPARSGVKQGTTIDGGEADGERGGVTHNERSRRLQRRRQLRRRRQGPERDRRRRPAAGRRRRRRLPVRRRRLPDHRQPDDDDRALRPGPDRRPQLRHRLLRDPALPAADLPGLRNRIRDPLGGAGLDQQNRDRVRHQPQRLQRRRRRLDAVPALELGNVRASTPTATGARTPTTRSTRSAPPPAT